MVLNGFRGLNTNLTLKHISSQDGFGWCAATKTAKFYKYGRIVCCMLIGENTGEYDLVPGNWLTGVPAGYEPADMYDSSMFTGHLYSPGYGYCKDFGICYSEVGRYNLLGLATSGDTVCEIPKGYRYNVYLTYISRE